MVCEDWKLKLDSYVDGELGEEELRAMAAHMKACPSCTTEILARTQMKRALHIAGSRYLPSDALRRRIHKSMVTKPRQALWMSWVLAAAAVVILVVSLVTVNYERSRGAKNVLSEVADLHVTAMASATPVDVISTDRHTVKPWFQGKIPFAFNLPEVQNTEFTLVGGRMAYLEQTAGAQLIYDIRKHHISVFIFPESAFDAHLSNGIVRPKASFNMETWDRDGLRYFVIGDANSEDLKKLAGMFKGGE
jgi:anti-sigma factor RsiW